MSSRWQNSSGTRPSGHWHTELGRVAVPGRSHLSQQLPYSSGGCAQVHCDRDALPLGHPTRLLHISLGQATASSQVLRLATLAGLGSACCT